MQLKTASGHYPCSSVVLDETLLKSLNVRVIFKAGMTTAAADVQAHDEACVYTCVRLKYAIYVI